MARSLRSSRRISAPRRKYSWELGPGQSAAQSAVSSGTPVLGSVGGQVVGEGNTLVRIRGEFLAYLNVSSDALGGLRGAFGIGKVRLSAFNAGAAACPSPITEENWDGWIFYQHLFLATITATIGDTSNVPTKMIRFPIDSKAMRKLDTDDIIYGVIEMDSEVGTATMQWYFNTRVLLKLP